jgi:membrane fusion protein (multidrug efflux system)
MVKKILLALIGIIVVVGGLAGIKTLQIVRMTEAAEQQGGQGPTAVTAFEVERRSWEKRIAAVGSLEAVQGVMVSTELPGKVAEIAFEPGTQTRKGQLLIRQDTSTERARLPGAEAEAVRARLHYERMKSLLEQNVISQAEYDDADAAYRQARSQVADIKAMIEKKTIRAPFAGSLGVRLVNLGQSLGDAHPVVSLQTLDPVFVNFSLPQQKLSMIGEGDEVRIKTDGEEGQSLTGRITTINPDVDPVTRNVNVQATVSNLEKTLRPGMYARVEVVLPQKKGVLVIPASAVLYAPYGNSVYVIDEREDGDGQVARQQFVRLGEARGDFVSVLDGVEEGQSVVSTGVFKLRNGEPVIVDNELSPEFKENPTPDEG